MSTPQIIRKSANKKPITTSHVTSSLGVMKRSIDLSTWVWDTSSLLWLALGVVWVGFIGLNYAYATQTEAGLNAFHVYYQGAEALLNGAPLYNGLDGWIYLYPPLFAQMLMPIVATGSYQLATALWYVVNLALLIGSLTMLSRYVPRERAKLLWIAPIVFIPVWQALYLGQVTIIMLALLTATWICVREDKPIMAGMLLALASWIKVFPAILVIYFIWKRDWRVLRGVALLGTILAVVQILISGPDVMFEFFEILLSLTSGGQPEATYENLSVLAFASRLFQENDRVIPLLVDETLFSIARWGMVALLLGVSGIAIFYSGATTKVKNLSWRFDLEYSLMVMAILLFGGTLWISGLPPLLLLYVLLLRNVDVFRLPFWVKAMSAVSFLLITTYQPLMLIVLKDSLDVVTLSLGFFGVLMLWFLLVQQVLKPKTIEA